MWQTATIKHNPQLTDSSVNSVLHSALSAVEIPADITQKNQNQAIAANDKRRELLASGQIKTATITPWNTGVPSGNKYNMSFYLSPADAIEKAAKIIENNGFETVILIAEMADNDGQLATNLSNLIAAFPSAELEQAARHAKKLAEHEEQKRFLNNEPLAALSRESAALRFFRLENVAAQNISVSEAIASDKSATQILTEFATRRAARLAEIQADLAALQASGTAQYAIKLSGGDLAEKLRNAKMPNQHAPMAVVFIMGGTTKNMKKISEALGL